MEDLNLIEFEVSEVHEDFVHIDFQPENINHEILKSVEMTPRLKVKLPTPFSASLHEDAETWLEGFLRC